jgi:hypothetical protein
MKREMVAPCGMNCNLCRWVLDPAKHECAGCRPRGRGCIYNKGLCRKLARQEIDFCYQCDRFPCERLLSVEKRYVHLYNYSQVENLNYIRRRGMPAFLERETKRYTCPSCGQLLTVHSDTCPHCRQRHARKNRR